MNQSIPTLSPTNGKAKALVDAARLCFLLLSSASHSILTFAKPKNHQETEKAKNTKAAKTLVAFIVSTSHFGMNPDQKISPAIRIFCRYILLMVSHINE
jgi:hypothetical protein